MKYAAEMRIRLQKERGIIMDTVNIENFINELVAALEQEIMGPEGEIFAQGLGYMLAFFAGLAIISGILFAINLICRWRIFSKAGEKGWKSLIPYYGTYVEFKFTWSGLQGILMLGALIASNIITATCETGSFMTLIGAVLAFYAAVMALIQTHKLSQSFGHKFGFTLGLLFLNPIFMLILAFGKKSQYVGPIVKNK